MGTTIKTSIKTYLRVYQEGSNSTYIIFSIGLASLVSPEDWQEEETGGHIAPTNTSRSASEGALSRWDVLNITTLCVITIALIILERIQRNENKDNGCDPVPLVQ